MFCLTSEQQAALDTKSPTRARAGLDGGAVRHTNHCFITKKSGLIAFEANRFIILSDTMTSQLPQSLIAPDYLTSDNIAALKSIYSPIASETLKCFEEAICSKSCANERRTELARVLPSAAKII